MKKNQFYKTVIGIALPVTLQSLLQSSFGVIDQVMTGQLGSTNIAGIGLGGKFSSLYSVLISAVAAAAGIMIAQYMGSGDKRGVSRSFWVNLGVGLLAAFLFLGVCSFFPLQVMGIYTEDLATRQVAADYLRIVALSYLPMAVTTLLATMLRCMDAASLPLYASIFSAVINTGMNYVLIFGKFGFWQLGVRGAAWATVISQITGCVLTVILFWQRSHKSKLGLKVVLHMDKGEKTAYLGILLPILVCEFLWSLGENVYAGIYGHIGTKACAAMTLTAPVQVLFIGALSGMSQAAGIIIGKSLGSGKYEKAYEESKKLMWYGLAGSLVLSVILICTRGLYLQIYRVEEAVKDTAYQILLAFAVIAPVKVLNMILGGGIIRSGGKTKYVMWIDIIGTWGFGVPLGLAAAFVLKWSIPYVYFMLSLEECVRLGISLLVFRKRSWMNSLK